MKVEDFHEFIILGLKKDGTTERFKITQAQAQIWIDRAGFFRPVILAGFSQLGAYRVPGEGTSGGEGLRGSDEAGSDKPQGATGGGEKNGGGAVYCPGCIATFGIDKGQ